MDSNLLLKKNVHGRFIIMDEVEFKNGAWAHLSKILGVPKTTLRRWATEKNPSTGLTWIDERKDIQQQIVKKTIGEIAEKKSTEKIKLIERDWQRLDTLNAKLQKFIDSDDFEVKEENLKIILEAYEKIKMNYAKMQEFINEGLSRKTDVTFNINVPLEYITPEGRRWLSRQVDNPTDAMLEGSFEVVADEKEMKLKNQDKIENRETSNTKNFDNI